MEGRMVEPKLDENKTVHVVIVAKKILTWENLRKRGVFGPSRCQLCE